MIDIKKKELELRIKKFCDEGINTEEVRNLYFNNKSSRKYLKGDTRGWKLENARKKIRKNNHNEYIKKISPKLIYLRNP